MATTTCSSSLTRSLFSLLKPHTRGASLSLPLKRSQHLCLCSSSDPQTLSHPPSSADPSPADPVLAAAGLLDIRVGRVVRACRHPEADSLYVEDVDVGEGEPRTICSGLVDYIPLADIELIDLNSKSGQGSKDVIVLANLKPRNMRGIKSNGMLMAASDASHENVELLAPPEGSIPGERIWFDSDEEKSTQPDAATPNQIQKKKIWESVQPHLKTTESCEACPSRTPSYANTAWCGDLQILEECQYCLSHIWSSISSIFAVSIKDLCFGVSGNIVFRCLGKSKVRLTVAAVFFEEDANVVLSSRPKESMPLYAQVILPSKK